MKYKVRRGSVGRPLVIKKLKRPEGTITIRSKRIRDNKIAKEIKDKNSTKLIVESVKNIIVNDKK